MPLILSPRGANVRAMENARAFCITGCIIIR